MTTKISGGVLPDWESPEFQKWWAECEERDAQHRQQEAAEAERQAELQAVYDRIDATFMPFLQEEADAVNKGARIRPADQKIFEQFKKYCAKWSPPLPPLPAHPAAVAAFLTEELPRLTRHLNAISRVHRAVGLPDPTRDVLCAALVRKFKHAPRSENSNQKEV